MSFGVNVDPTNPGQFFACCGLLELADRLWPGGATAAFSHDATSFVLARTEGPTEHDAKELFAALAHHALTSTMSAEQIARLKQLKNLNKKLRTAATDEEAGRLDELWQRERLCVPVAEPLWLDWWADEAAGGSRFKTWAGKQLISDLARGLQSLLRADRWSDVGPEGWLSESVDGGVLPLYFDAATGAQASSLDIGFSLDAIDMPLRTKPLLELAAFVGLQRFRPQENRTTETFTYAAWTEQLPPSVAAAACNGAVWQSGWPRFEFRLLFRTKYLKSFLPATPTRGHAR